MTVLEQAGIPHILVSDRFEPGRFAVRSRTAPPSSMPWPRSCAPLRSTSTCSTSSARPAAPSWPARSATPPDGRVVVYRSWSPPRAPSSTGPTRAAPSSSGRRTRRPRDLVAPASQSSRRGFALPSLAPDATITFGDRSVATTHDMLEPTNDDITSPSTSCGRGSMTATRHGGHGATSTCWRPAAPVRSARRRPVRQPGRAQVLHALGGDVRAVVPAPLRRHRPPGPRLARRRPPRRHRGRPPRHL